jgi:integrase
MRAKLTKTLIDRLEVDPERDRVVLDTEAKGFGVRVTRRGVKSFVFQWGRGARRMRMTLGAFGDLTLEKARRMAADCRTAVTAGRDPQAEVRFAKLEPTVQELAGRFMEEHAANKAPSTARLYRLVLDSHLVPLLGRRLVSSIRWEDLARLRTRLSDRPTLANRALVTCSVVWEFGRRVGWVARGAPNPARGHHRADERRRGRALDSAQLGRIGLALAAEGDSTAAACFRFILLTGCRPAEAFAARWPDVDLEGRRWRLQEAKAGPRTVYLGRPAAELLVLLCHKL